MILSICSSVTKRRRYRKRRVRPGLLFEKQSTLQSVSQMEQGYPTSHCPGTGRRTTGGTRIGKGSFSFHPIHGRCLVIPYGEIHDRYPYDGWNAHTATELKLRGFEEPGREAGGAMLNITGKQSKKGY